MKKIVFTAPRSAEIRECEIPSYGANEVLLQNERIGVCGTDIQVFMGRNRYMQFPVTPFHEGVARVVKTGKDVKNVKAGERVTIRPILSCGHCYSCERGHENACENFNCLGVQSDGLGAEYFVIDKHYVYPISKKCPLDQAVLIEPFAVGVHAAVRGKVCGRRVLVVGAGTIGNFTAQACGLLGAKQVCICDLSEDKVKMAERSGISICLNSHSRTLTDVAKEAFGTFPDVIIDCVGAKAVLPQILELAGKTTDIVIVGKYSEPVLIDVAKIQRNELNVYGNITYTEEDFRKAVELVMDQKVYMDGFISAKFQFDQAQEMMDFAAENRGINMKVVMDYGVSGCGKEG